jgi:hypothetical protein
MLQKGTVNIHGWQQPCPGAQVPRAKQRTYTYYLNIITVLYYLATQPQTLQYHGLGASTSFS